MSTEVSTKISAGFAVGWSKMNKNVMNIYHSLLWTTIVVYDNNLLKKQGLISVTKVSKQGTIFEKQYLVLKWDNF